MNKSEKKSVLAFISLFVASLCSTISWYLYSQGNEEYIFAAGAAAFNWILTFVHFFGYLSEKDQETVQEIYKNF